MLTTPPSLQIFNKTQREVIWDLEAAFMEKKDFSLLMDQVIERKLLDGNSAQEPRKTVRIMVSTIWLVCDSSMIASGQAIRDLFHLLWWQKLLPMSQ
jgi:hypothetical protein